MASPTLTAETKKNTGSRLEYQSGCSFCGMIRNSEPSDDWCSVERSTPASTSGTVILFQMTRAFPHRRRCQTDGANSSARTAV